MSYCRWSCDNWKCDVYCYADVAGGYTTHVAGNRIVSEIPQVPPLTRELLTDEAKMSAWMQAHNAQMAALETVERAPITLHYAGESLHDDTLEQFRATLSSLRELGYNVPQFVFDAIDEEIAEQTR